MSESTEPRPGTSPKASREAFSKTKGKGATPPGNWRNMSTAKDPELDFSGKDYRDNRDPAEVGEAYLKRNKLGHSEFNLFREGNGEVPGPGD